MKHLAVILACVLLLPCLAYSQATKSKCSVLSDDFEAAASAYELRKGKKDLKALHEKAEAIEKYSAERYQDMELQSISGSSYSRDLSMIEYKYCAPRALDALLRVAQKYVDAGIFDTPRKIYRDIITTYTGQAWTSYVKKAEFGLEDLKAAEAKRKAKK